jgi:hypothetical protein
MGTAASHPTTGGFNSASAAPHSNSSRARNDQGNSNNAPISASAAAVRMLPNSSSALNVVPIDGGEIARLDEIRAAEVAIYQSVGGDNDLGQQQRTHTIEYPDVGGSVSTTQVPGAASHIQLNRPEPLTNRVTTYVLAGSSLSSSIPISPVVRCKSASPVVVDNATPFAALASTSSAALPCLNPASEINSRLDTQVEIKVYPCSNSSHSGNNGRKKVTQFMVKPEVRNLLNIKSIIFALPSATSTNSSCYISFSL